MRKLLGVDFPKVIDDALKKANGASASKPITSVGYGTLTWISNTPTTRDPTHQTSGLRPTQTSYVVRAKVAEIPLNMIGMPLGQINVHAGDMRVEIYTNSIPKGADGEPVALPDEDDQVVIGTITRTIYYAPKTASNAKVVCYAR